MFDWKGVRAAVIGGAGFIGSFVVEELVRRGAKVLVLDNLSRGSLRNLEEVQPYITFKLVDFMYPEAVGSLKGCDVAFCLAAKVTGIQYNMKNHYDMLWHNAVVTLNMLEGVRRYVDRAVYTSTACVYPHDAPVPTPESYGLLDTPEPTNEGYGWAKRFGERAASVLRRKEGKKIATTRFFNSITEDQHVLFYDVNGLFHFMPAAEAFAWIQKHSGQITVPAFDPQSRELKEFEAEMTQHEISKKCYKVTTRTGRSVKVTRDHSLFVFRQGEFRPCPTEDIQEGDVIAVPGRLSLRERPPVLDLAELCPHHRSLYVEWEGDALADVCDAWLRVFSSADKTPMNQGLVPFVVAVLARCEFDRVWFVSKSRRLFALRRYIKVREPLLYELGRFARTGSLDVRKLGLLDLILDGGEERASQFVRGYLGVGPESIPPWLVQMPTDCIRVFLKGLLGRRKFIQITSPDFLVGAQLLLLRLGAEFVVKEDRLVIKSLEGNLPDVIADEVVSMEPFILRRKNVYDFSVPGAENFIAGSTVFAHNSYGPRDYFDKETSHVIPSLIDKIYTTDPVEIWGSGNQTRVFVHARDLAQGLIRVAETDKCFQVEAINIGHDQEVSIRDLFFMLCEIMNKHPRPLFDTSRPEGYPRRAADFSLLKELTGFTCTTPLKQGLEETVEWYLTHVAKKH